MSFRARLTLFFVLIVVVPMVALGVVVARLLSDSQHAKAVAQNRASAAAALADVRRLEADGGRAARTLARDPGLAAALATPSARADLTARARTLAAQLGLARVRIVGAGGTTLADVGDRTAIAPGAVRLHAPAVMIEAAALTAAQFVRTVSVHGVSATVRREGALLASTLPRPIRSRAKTRYATASFAVPGFARTRTTVTILTDTSAAADAAARGRTIAFALLAAFLLLAFAGALLVSRQLHGQLARFLVAARRIGGGDFSTTVPVEGDDEFAQLGREFNKMSSELEQRLGELADERARLRESIQRVGATFAANLDRAALLEIGTQTAVDAVEAQCGRATIRATASGALCEAARVGRLVGAEAAVAAAEAQAHELGGPASATVDDVDALAAPIAPHDEDAETSEPRGLVTVARRGRPFSDAERELLASLARQTGISLENVDLHEQVKRQAVTDELTGLSNHRRFQQTIAAEAAAARRFEQPLGLVMIDVDDFKRVNDTYGHQQGDLVLREVARVLRDCSREVDEPARYGGEELAVALQQTDLPGAEATAERIRTAVEALELPRLDGAGTLRVTVSCGVAASSDGDPPALVAAADAALYEAKRTGKNRTVCAQTPQGAAIPVDAAAG